MEQGKEGSIDSGAMRFTAGIVKTKTVRLIKHIAEAFAHYASSASA